MLAPDGLKNYGKLKRNSDFDLPRQSAREAKGRGAGCRAGHFGIYEGVHHALRELSMMSNALGRGTMKGKDNGEIAEDAPPQNRLITLRR